MASPLTASTGTYQTSACAPRAPHSAANTASCPALCASAPPADKINGVGLAKRCKSHITPTLKSPPHRLRAPATAPRASRASSAFSTARQAACGSPRNKRANITTVLASPGFTPGGRPRAGASAPSNSDSTAASANSTPSSAARRAAPFSFLPMARPPFPRPRHLRRRAALSQPTNCTSACTPGASSKPFCRLRETYSTPSPHSIMPVPPASK